MKINVREYRMDNQKGQSRQTSNTAYTRLSTIRKQAQITRNSERMCYVYIVLFWL